MLIANELNISGFNWTSFPRNFATAEDGVALVILHDLSDSVANKV